MNQEIKEGQWCYSESQEIYRGNFDSKEEAILEGVAGCDLTEGSVLSVAQIKKYHPAVDTENVIETLVCQASDECGETVEDWELNNLTSKDEEWQELDLALNAVFSKWLEKHKYVPRFYSIDNDKEITVTKEML